MLRLLASVRAALRLCPRDAQDGINEAVDIGYGGGPVGDGDAHRGLALPGGAAQPVGAVALKAGDDAAGGGIGFGGAGAVRGGVEARRAGGSSCVMGVLAVMPGRLV